MPLPNDLNLCDSVPTVFGEDFVKEKFKYLQKAYTES